MLEILKAFVAAAIFFLACIPLWPILGAGFVHWKMIRGRSDPYLAI